MSSADLVEVKKEPLSPDTSVSEDNAPAAAATTSGDAAPAAAASTTTTGVEAALENLEIKKEIKEEPRSEDYNKLLNYGLDGKVAGRLEEIYNTGKKLAAAAAAAAHARQTRTYQLLRNKSERNI